MPDWGKPLAICYMLYKSIWTSVQLHMLLTRFHLEALPVQCSVCFRQTVLLAWFTYQELISVDSDLWDCVFIQHISDKSYEFLTDAATYLHGNWSAQTGRLQPLSSLLNHFLCIRFWCVSTTTQKQCISENSYAARWKPKYFMEMH